MSFRLTLLCLCCAFVLAGCQTTGQTRTSAPTPANDTSSAPAAVAPWQEARANGMIFRAVGTHPAWSVEVQKSRTPTLFVVLNNGQSQLQVADTTPFGDQQTGTVGFRGTADDGTAVTLTIQRGQCQDDMHRQKLDAAAQLDVGTQHYKG